MKRNIAVLARFTVFSGCMLVFVFLLISWSRVIQGHGSAPTHLTTDWSHRHMVFSAPSSIFHAWRLQAEPRYLHQLVRLNARPQHSNAQAQRRDDQGQDDDRDEDHDTDRDGHRRRANSLGLHTDWGMSLLIDATAGSEMFPAKFSFDVNATPDCTNDFVVFNTGVTPVAKDASATGTFTGAPANGQTTTITNGGNSETLTASGAAATGTITIGTVPVAGDTVTVGATTYTFDTSATGTITINSVPSVGDTVTVGATIYKFVTTLALANDVLIVSGSTANTATNLRAAINASAGQCFISPCFGTGTTANASVTATRASNVVTVTAITSGTGGNSILFATTSGGITLSPGTGMLSGGAGGTLSTANEVLAVTGSTQNTAQNLRAAINANAGQCFSSTCFGAGTTANASVTATRASNVVTVTAITFGTSGNTIMLSTSSGGRMTVSGATLSGGVNGSNTGTNFLLDGNNTNAATNLAAAIVRNNAGVGVTATSNGSTVTVTATTAGSAGNSITLTGVLNNFSWSGGTLSGGNDGQPTIIAFNELYSTQGSVGGLCNQNGPSVMWSYNTNPAGDTTGTDVTSPVLSLDGTKVAYVETRTNGNGGAILHILKWKSGQGTLTTPVAPNQVVASWGSCTAGNSCVVNITFGNAQPDSNSSPYYNYSNDTLYVGDDNGVLHKFGPVFSGTPAEVTTGGWPITVHTATVLSSPVFDSGSGNILVGDSGGQLSYARETGSTTGSCSSGSPPCLGTPNIALTGSIVDAPLVDGSTQRAIWFDGQDTTHFGEIVQTDMALGNQRTLTGVGGSGTPTSNMHVGSFDHTYLTSPSNNIAGFLYFCGKNNGANRDHPSLWRVGFNTSGLMNTTADGGATAFLDLVGTSGEEASPVTELYNGTTDRIFFSVGNNSSQCGSGPGGCMMSLTLGGAWPPTAVTNTYPTPVGPNITVSGGTVNQAGTSGIVVDNVSASAQASSLYFSFTGNSVAGAQCNGLNGVGCAVKLTQSALQ